MNFKFLSLVLWLGFFLHSVHSETPAGKSVWSFQQASAPFENESYNFEGYVDKSGKVRNGGLGCSGYASAILHRMQFGDEWLKNYSLKVHQQYGDEMARLMGLKKVTNLSLKQTQDPAFIKKLIQEKALQTDQWYFFNVRKDKAGHVGFLKVGADGTLEQRHYSKLGSYNGLAKGEFHKWLSRSQYKAQAVEIYWIP